MPRQNIAALKNQQFDIVVIGAGINGASSAQHLAAAGYSVLLVDKGDFGSGSTSRSSRLMHCGLRYFETPRSMLDFTLSPARLAVALKMVRSSMQVRTEIARDSSQRVRPFKMLFPVHRTSPYKGWQVDLAFKILGRSETDDVPLDYQRLSAQKCADLPFVSQLSNQQDLRSVAMFTEYMFDWPERFCIDAVLDAERLGAVVLNYTSASPVERDSDGLWTVELADQSQQAQRAKVRAPIILNTAGIWIDQVNQSSQKPARRLILGTKGSHIVVKLAREFRDYGISTINAKGEPHYVLPSQGGFHHIGPTETVYEGDLNDIRVDEIDRAFLISQTNAILPGLQITEADVVYTWAGVRPLGYDPAIPEGKRSVEIHDLASDGRPGVYALTAGPIMTHRNAGRDVARTIAEAIPPTREPQELDYTPQQFPDNPNSPSLEVTDPSIKLSDLAHAATKEHGVTLTDILISRTGALYSGALSDASIQRAAQEVGIHLGWNRAEIDRQIKMLRNRLADTYQIGRV